MVFGMPRPPRTLVIGINYAPETTGIAPYTAGMSRGLTRRGHTVRVTTAHPHYPRWKIAPGYGQWSRREHLDGVRVDRRRHFVPTKPHLVPRTASEASFGLRAAGSRWGRPDVIVTVSPALISASIVRLRAMLTHRHVPFIVWVQDLYGRGVSETAQGSSVAARIIALVEAWLLRSATTVVVIHDRFADLVHHDFDIPRERIKVIRNWTHLPPLPTIDVCKVRDQFGWAEDETVVVHSGNMGVKQGLHHVVDAGRLAAARGVPIRFVLIGDGSRRAEIEKLCSREDVSVQLVPPLDDDDFGRALQAADILLVNELPGVSEMAVPSKLTSYFAAGRPVIAATDERGITASEVMAARAGVVVPAGDPEALLQAALALADDEEGRRQFGQNGKNYRETVLDETFAIDQFDSLLANLTKHRTAASVVAH